MKRKSPSDWNAELESWKQRHRLNDDTSAKATRRTLRRDTFSTSSDIELPDLFGPTFDDPRYADRIGFPGEYPFTRGIHPTMYRERLWSMRQYAGFGTAEVANQRYRYLLAQGTTGLSVAFDLPTQMGFDSDDPFARGEVGRVGVAIATVEDMERLFDGIPLDQISTSMTINATAFILLAFYLVVAERRGISWDALRGTVQNDVLKEYIARGTYIYPPKQAMRIVTDMFEFCQSEVPQWNTISISGYHIREAGSTAAQELAFTFANAIAYVEAACAQGLSVDSFAPRLAFFFNCHDNFLEEVAKFRAARRLWALIMRERFAAKDPRSMMLRFHTQTAGSTLTAQQPLTNTVRTTLQALAAVFGGTQSLHTNAYDEALCLPTEQAATLALRTQQIIAMESGVADVVDPWAGSYAIESLTDSLEQECRKLLSEIDSLGGMVRAIEMNFPQQRIEEAAYAYQKLLESKQAYRVGVNIFADEHTLEGNAVELLQVDPRLEEQQIERIQLFRAERDAAAVKAALEKLREEVSAGRVCMPAVLNAVRAHATLGEIANVLRLVFGEFHPTA